MSSFPHVHTLTSLQSVTPALCDSKMATLWRTLWGWVLILAWCWKNVHFEGGIPTRTFSPPLATFKQRPGPTDANVLCFGLEMETFGDIYYKKCQIQKTLKVSKIQCWGLVSSRQLLMKFNTLSDDDLSPQNSVRSLNDTIWSSFPGSDCMICSSVKFSTILSIFDLGFSMQNKWRRRKNHPLLHCETSHFKTI